MVPDTGIKPARVFPWRPKSYIVLSFLWKSKVYPIGTGQKIAYLFPAPGTEKMSINIVYWLLQTSCGRKRTAMANVFLRPAR